LIAAALVVRGYLNGGSPMHGFFGPKPHKRLDVVDHQSIDGRRRLVLVRRDDVEHLIMTGGPVDVVIETGISARCRAHRDAARGGRTAGCLLATRPQLRPGVGRGKVKARGPLLPAAA